MPSGPIPNSNPIHPSPRLDPTPIHNQGQNKVCSDCQRHLPPDQGFLHDSGGDGHPEDTVILCANCRQTHLSQTHSHDRRGHHTFSQPPGIGVALGALPDGGATRAADADRDSSSRDYSASYLAQVDSLTLLHPGQSLSESQAPTNTTTRRQQVAAPRPPLITSAPPPSSAVRRALSEPLKPVLAGQQVPSSGRRVTSPTSSPTRPSPPSSPTEKQRPQAPDPFVDITRIRTRSRGVDCLYPGSRFTGTQKSGRSSYDVTVVIVNVDFASSFLCGYLQIKGLTDDWPELTTYFDAEIIGPRHGFITQDWGATEADDIGHWSRFPPFNAVRNELQGSNYRMKDYPDSRCVFMRWKERFLVPDYRVRDINGASFAGFYYVCVDFDPSSRHGSGSTPVSPNTSSEERHSLPPESVLKREREDHRSGSTATMKGYYFHQSSEPFQELSLHHERELARGSFEFR